MKHLSFLIASLFISLTISAQSEQLQRLVHRIKPSVFTVCTLDKSGNEISSGSGFFISSTGVGLTNYHVLEGAYSAYIIDSKNKKYKIGKIIDYNKDVDIVKFQIDNPSKDIIKPLPISSTLPKQGESIINYSTPLGLFDNTVSTGVVSSLREYEGYGNVLQITAPISHGSSGSPVMNTQGEVVGIATFGINEGQNLNFAVSITRLKVLNRILNIPVKDIGRTPLETDLVLKAVEQADQGNYGSAINYLEQELSKNQNNHFAYNLKGRIECGAKEYGDGLDDLGMACAMDTTNFKYHCDFSTYLMLAYIDLAEDDGSEDIMKTIAGECMDASLKAINLDPTSSKPYANMANLLYYLSYSNPDKEKLLNMALESINQAIKIDHKASYYLIRRDVDIKLGELGKALLDCDEAIKMEPNNCQCYIKRADLYIFEYNQMENGLADLDRALVLANSPYAKADVLGMKGMAYEKLMLDPKTTEWDALMIYAKKGLECFDEAIKLSPNANYIGAKKDFERSFKSWWNDHCKNFGMPRLGPNDPLPKW